MKISLNWLKELMNLDGFTIEQIEHQLTMSGLEVEEVINQGAALQNFVVGYVLEKEKHPKADKLSVTKVDVGTEVLQIVCGAPNVAAGQKVMVALEGATVPSNGMTIGKVKLRGIDSSGMICSDSEIGLSDDHSGIRVLEENAKQGTQLAEYLGLNDVIFEIGITPNRADALSHFGVARELQALLGVKAKFPEVYTETEESRINSVASLSIEDEYNCPRYSAVVVEGVTVGESPDWLKRRLKAVGLRSINNVVDATNYILFETGQPLHAFDLDTLAGNAIVVKQAGEQKEFVTLDSQKRALDPSMLMICDAEKPVALAGVMGGENSEVTLQTKRLLIESAYFNPSSIRKTAKKAGLSTDASYRFERGIDYEGTLYSAKRCAMLIQQIAGGTIVPGVIDNYPKPLKREPIHFRFSQIRRILGYEITNEEAISIFEKLGFGVGQKTEHACVVEVGGFRTDIDREIDLIEELARIYGYDSIPSVPKISVSLQSRTDESSFAGKTRDLLVGLGFNEILNTTLVNEKNATRYGTPIRLLNPNTIDMEYLRTALFPAALDTVKRNINVGEKNLRLFEIGRVTNKHGEQLNSFADFTEEENLLILLTGEVESKEWFREGRYFDLYDLKGFLNAFLKGIHLDNSLEVKYYSTHKSNNLFESYFEKRFNGELIGFGGKVDKQLLLQYDLNQPVYLFELSLDKLKNVPLVKPRFKELLRFPKVYRDFAFVFDKAIEYSSVESFIRKASSALLEEVSLFDAFEHESLGSDKKSLALSLTYSNSERTLTEDEIEKEFKNLITAIEKEFNAKLRG